MDMTGSNLVLRAAIERGGHGDTKLDNSPPRSAGTNLAEALNDTSYSGRLAAERNFAAVTGLIVMFLGILLAIGAMTQSADDPTTAGEPAPVGAPTAVIEIRDHTPPFTLADSPEPAG